MSIFEGYPRHTEAGKAVSFHTKGLASRLTFLLVLLYFVSVGLGQEQPNLLSFEEAIPQLGRLLEESTLLTTENFRNPYVSQYRPEDKKFSFTGSSWFEVQRLQDEFGQVFPPELQRYLKDYAPSHNLMFSHPFVNYGIIVPSTQQASRWVAGWSSLDGTADTAFDDWPPNFFILGNAGGDGVYIVDLDDKASCSCVWFHEPAASEVQQVASSIPNFLMLMASRTLYENGTRDSKWLKAQLERLEGEDSDAGEFWLAYLWHDEQLR